jgi:adiponectin receptor
MYSAYGSGVLVYLLRLPERWKPGYFNIVANSHQIWHFMILLAAFAQYLAIRSLFLFNEEGMYDSTANVLNF